MLIIRKTIETYESLVAPELNRPASLLKNATSRGLMDSMDFHQAKWTLILQKNTTDVDQLKELLSKAGILEKDFCRRMGSFFLIASANIHLPTLKSYTPDQMYEILSTDFHVQDEITIKCVRDVLMRI